MYFVYWPYTVHNFTSGLRPAGLANSLTNYTDDAIQLLPEKTDVEMYEEFYDIIKWPDKKLTVNTYKTKEIVFHRSNPKPMCHLQNYIECRVLVLLDC